MASKSHAKVRFGGFHQPLRLADLASLDPSSGELDRRLTALDRAARIVIGDNLARGSLQLDTLRRLRASVVRQIGEAEALMTQLGGTGVPVEVELRLAALRDFLEDSLREIDRQTGSASRAQ